MAKREVKPRPTLVLTAVATTVLVAAAAFAWEGSPPAEPVTSSSPLISGGWETSVSPSRSGDTLINFAITVKNVSSDPARPTCRAYLDGTNVVDDWDRLVIGPREVKRITGTMVVSETTSPAQLEDLEPSCH